MNNETRKETQVLPKDVRYVGADDLTLPLFENQYPVQPMGVIYNSYLILDEKVAVMDSVDACRGAADAHEARGNEGPARVRCRGVAAQRTQSRKRGADGRADHGAVCRIKTQTADPVWYPTLLPQDTARCIVERRRAL